MTRRLCHHCGKLADEAITVVRMPPPNLPARLMDELDWSRLPYLYCSERCADEHWPAFVAPGSYQ